MSLIMAVSHVLHSYIKESEVPPLLKNTSLSCVVLKIKAELDQAGANHVIQKYPNFFHPMFVKLEEHVLSAGRYDKMKMSLIQDLCL